MDDYVLKITECGQFTCDAFFDGDKPSDCNAPFYRHERGIRFCCPSFDTAQEVAQWVQDYCRGY